MDQYVSVAVSTVPYSVDRPYDYRLPSALLGKVFLGARVIVPFGRGNKKVEAVALSVGSEKRTDAEVKTVVSLLDETPALDERMIRLALWMRDRMFCTVYEAVRAMLPAGLWYEMTDVCRILPGVTRETAAAEGDEGRLLEFLFSSGGSASVEKCAGALGKDPANALKKLVSLGLCQSAVTAKRRVSDKVDMRVSLSVSPEEAAAAVTNKSAHMQRAVLRLLCDVGSALVREVCYFTGASTRTIKSLESSGLVVLSEVPVYRRPASGGRDAPAPITLNAEQEAAYIRLVTSLGEGTPACGLLYGVTGSGKTSVYIRLIEHILTTGGRCIVMVPEIALTPQLMALFSAHFGSRVALLHSALSIGERADEWRRIKSGLADVVVGTRSCVFAPVENLRLIIMDEEQEQSYKSESSPRYHARDVAKFRCVQSGALLLLGSATPSVESFQAARDGNHIFCALRKRYNENPLPEVRIVSMRDEFRQGNKSTISLALHEEIRRNIEDGRQSILLLNRRGYNSRFICPSCGESPICPRCTISMTYHSANGRMMCHCCGHSEKRLERCRLCGAELRPVGAGTQKAAEELEALFPGVAVLRMDTDTTGARGAHEQMLERFRTQKIPLLVGTQMVAKGLDFENVTLVGVLCADGALMMDDFRAHERAFSLITQVVGRAGRGGKPGRAVIQSYAPDHPVLLAAAAQDYVSFFENEAALRSRQGYPPFGAMSRLTLFGMIQEDVLRAALRVRGWIDRAGVEGLGTLGPAPDRIARVNMRFRYHITLLGARGSDFRKLIAGILGAFPADRQNRGVSVYADYSPYN